MFYTVRKSIELSISAAISISIHQSTHPQHFNIINVNVLLSTTFLWFGTRYFTAFGLLP